MSIIDSSGLHYLLYDEAKLQTKRQMREANHHLKSERRQQPKNVKNALPCSTSVEKESVDLTSSIPMTAQNARAKLTLLAKSISSFEYSCGAFLFPPDTNSKTLGTLCAPHSSLQYKFKFLIMDWT